MSSSALVAALCFFAVCIAFTYVEAFNGTPSFNRINHSPRGFSSKKNQFRHISTIQMVSEEPRPTEKDPVNGDSNEAAIDGDINSVEEQEKMAIEAGPCSKEFPKCSGEGLKQGCDGTGRIKGGMAAIPGFGWWPIKVWRPCPAFLTAGYRYQRQGQSLNEVVFGEVGEGDEKTFLERLQGDDTKF